MFCLQSGESPSIKISHLFFHRRYVFKVMTRGIACSNSNCENRVHEHCFVNFRKRHGACSQCGKEWPADVKDEALIHVGEDAARDGDDARRRVRIQSAEPSDEDEEEPSQTPNVSQSQRPPQRSQRTRTTSRKQDKSMEVEEDFEAPTQKKSTRSQAKSRR